MTLEQLEQNKLPTLTIKEAATIMGITPRYLHMALQQERFPFGTAVKMEGRWSYYINTERFIRYMKGELIA